MALPIIMPRQGQSVESCIITAWNKKVGDTVEKGDILFSYETDKSSFDEPAPEGGKILAIFCEEGDDVPCLETVCVIGRDGEDFSAFIPKSDDAEEAAPAAEAAAPAAAEAAPAAEAAAPVAAAEITGAISPRAKILAAKTGADLLKAAPTGPNGRIIERDVQSLLDRGLTVSGAASEGYTTAVEGSGINGKVVLSDLAPKAPAAAAPAAEAAAPVAEYVDEKLPNIRKVIAKSMHASLSTMAQLTLNTSFDATKLMAFRASLKNGAEKMGLANITLNDMVLYAVSRVLLNHRSLNAHYLDDTMRFFNTVNLGIAVDTERGLLVPTVFGAEKLTLNGLSRAAKSVITEAQQGTISPDKLKGGTFTVTNLGSLGIESFTPVINPPQTGILGVDTITRRIKEVNGEDVSYPAMGLSLTFDHRALDGAPAAKFLKELCFALENFDLLLAK
ncbi:MAG: 2-oxo acid dehydrogenase subunit E2 [Ruminococcaceae bacterium]|nr:2-oxo acid dehydrogenase subunit E2 [Oscillospiraceae bacterium]